ncbi:MAG TPA: DUF5060 domain-containing protein [Thermoanaerobaculia bacterium]|nr:DUF5060 domain-containing protein [Thermoanaerobaculia bacterium]
MTRSVLSLSLLAGALAPAFLAPPAAAAPRFGTEEIVVRSTATFNGLSGTPNPFTAVSLTAKVTSPSGATYTVPGFFDGDGLGGATGNVWKIRIYADRVGTWKWTTSSATSGLGGKSGTFSCSGALAGRFAAGPIVENPQRPRSFMHQYGGPVFLAGKFLDQAASDPLKWSHTMFSEKMTETNRQALLTRHQGMSLNKINVYLANKGDYGGTYPTTPWIGGASSNDKTRFDLKRWRTYEQWVVKLRNAGFVAQLWFFADDSGFGDLPDADRKRLIHYGMARLSGYVNTVFTGMLEWQEGWTTTEVSNHMTYLQQQNPWARHASVHGTTGDFSFPSAAWADYMDTQPGNSASHATVHSHGVRNRALAAKPLIIEEFGLGLEDTAGRQKAWAAFLSGGAGIGTGAFLKRLTAFVPRVPFHLMDPNQALVRSGTAYALAQKGSVYLFYLPNGGTVSVDLASATGTLYGEWYNPRDGASVVAPTVAGGGVRTYTPPGAGDWVLRVRK